jgi:hypothetical protein
MAATGSTRRLAWALLSLAGAQGYAHHPTLALSTLSTLSTRAGHGAARVAAASRARTPRSAVVARDSESKSLDNKYNDDCFGLIFFTGALYAQDLAFSGAFAVLSFAAVLAALRGVVTEDQVADGVVPAGVAVTALLVGSGIAAALELPTIALTSPPELAACGVSVALAALRAIQRQLEE